ncbi:MAG: hypothetical protein L0228_16890 [Planctomycetes bacterium]|nr:hypothetical protein [Planctomycetota bacterium]
MAAKMKYEDLPPELLKQLHMRRPRQAGFSKESVRSWSLKALAMMSGLSQDQRRRVLEHAMRVNRL